MTAHRPQQGSMSSTITVRHASIFIVLVLLPWICFFLCEGALEWCLEPVPCSPAALRSSLEPVTETSSSPPQIHSEDVDVGQLFLLILNFTEIPVELSTPAQLHAPQGPCDLAVSPQFWHSPACAPPDGQSRWTPGKVLESARKDAAALWVANDKHGSISAAPKLNVQCVLLLRQVSPTCFSVECWMIS